MKGITNINKVAPVPGESRAKYESNKNLHNFQSEAQMEVAALFDEDEDKGEDDDKESGDEGEGGDDGEEEEGRDSEGPVRDIQDDDNEENVDEEELRQQRNLEEKLKVKEYGKIKERQKIAAKKTIKDFVKQYMRGDYTQNALGDLKRLDEDSIVEVLTDMLHYNNPYLIVQAMNLMYRHFK
jgi:hypothetical protein